MDTPQAEDHAVSHPESTTEIPQFLIHRKFRTRSALFAVPNTSPNPINDLIVSTLPAKHLKYARRKRRTRINAIFQLLHNLAQQGWKGKLSKNGSDDLILALANPDIPSNKEQLRTAMAPRRLELIRRSADWIRRNEPEILRNFVNGNQISPAEIKPQIEECITDTQKDIFRYCRYLGSAPYSEYVGRRMHFLIRDASLPERPLMGIAALGSSILQIHCRDEWIGWNNREVRKIKKLRIAHMMDLFVSIAIPPYNDLLAGKLICYIMASNEIRKAFELKYENRVTLSEKRVVKDLVMLVTTGIYGHSSQYNRLMYKQNRLYIPIGETIGFSTFQIGEETFKAFRNMLDASDKDLSHKFGDGANWRLRVLRTSMEHLGFDADQILQYGQPRSVYAVPLAKNAKEFLRGETNAIDYFDYPLADLISYWHERWLKMRIQNAQIMERVWDFRKESLCLTASLNER